jgi:hypothetical protein
VDYHHIGEVLEHSYHFSSRNLLHSTDDSAVVNSKMADNCVRLKLRALIELLAAEGDKPACIRELLLTVYGEANWDVNAARP